MEEMITITKAKYKSLVEESAHLSALESLGVDNWGNYVGPYNYCKACEAEGTWADAKCRDCGAEMPDAFDY